MYIFCIYVVLQLRMAGNGNYRYCSSKRVNVKNV